ncbi:hypothetical protein FOC1_g10008959 [Fusarium oxysporum f. sp. cubense race 1]|uniref:Uncharacterized protein n=1 Tax=Fusarium oxysporum f. sp. cubense (strain race 1) TaxID=1229664 RepID=N4UCB9_FUSC1|nr:hypothetical protein FOC1_g10008959 [Fusarium oxysporum f. sp. cubense race 1]
MDAPTLPETESPYRRFTRNTIEHRPGYSLPCGVPTTITDRDGSVLHETEDIELFFEILHRDDVELFEKYLTVQSATIPRIFSLPDEDERIYEASVLFCDVIGYGSLGILLALVSRELEYCGSPETIRFKKFGFQLLTEAAKWGHLKMVEFFLDNQPLYADIYERDSRGNTALLSAVDIYNDRYIRYPCWDQIHPEKNWAVIKLLLERGARASDVLLPVDDDVDQTPNTVLTLAAQWASPEIIKTLIDCGANVHAKVTFDAFKVAFYTEPQYISGVTALFTACLCGNFQAAKTLVDCRGADVNLADMIRSPDGRGLLPIHWASRNDQVQECRDIPTSVFEERAQNTISTIKLLLEYDPTTINIQDNEGNTPLHHATQTLNLNKVFYTDICRFLCDKGADASIRNNRGQTPLHFLFHRAGASLPVDVAATSILLAHGARPNDADKLGVTPLHLAAMRLESMDAMSCLLQHGGDSSQRTLKQETALHRAASGTSESGGVRSEVEESIRAQDEMLERLINVGGAELMDSPNAAGKTPRQICQERRDEWRRIEQIRSSARRWRETEEESEEDCEV